MKISNLLDDFKVGIKWTYDRPSLSANFVLAVLLCNTAILLFILGLPKTLFTATVTGGAFAFINTMFFLMTVRLGRHVKDMRQINELMTLLEDATREFAEQYYSNYEYPNYPNYEGYSSFEERASRFEEDIPDEEF